MKTRLLLFAVLALLFPRQAESQLVPGQYEDEAPLGSWNAPGIGLAPSLGCGDVRIAFGWDPSASLVNPALLFDLPPFTAAVSGAHSSASLFRYSILNTGVLSTEGNLTESTDLLDFAGVAFRLGRWAFSFSASRPESYDRPSLSYQYLSEGQAVYSIDAGQRGFLRIFHVSAARKISGRLSAGLGFNIISGTNDRTIVENFISDGITIADTKNQSIKGFYLNGGARYAFSKRLSAAIAFRTTCRRKTDNRSLLSYRVPAAGTDIRLAASSEDSALWPWFVGAGAVWSPSEELRFFSDLSFFNWSSYALTFFGEDKERAFRNVVRIAAGAEVSRSYRLFGRPVRMPFRIGLLYDPQPMDTPRSAYLSLTFGTGISFGPFRLDLAAALGREHGSGNGLAVRRGILTLTFAPGDGPER